MKRFYTVILVPHAEANFQKLHVSRSALALVLISLASLAAIFGWSAYENYRFYSLYGTPLRPTNVDTDAIAETLESSTEQLNEALRQARSAVVSLQQAAEERGQELAEVRARYEALKGLTEGQEEIAEVHRRILQNVSPLRRLFDILIGAVVGIFGGLGANAIWRAWIRREPTTLEELRKSVRDEVMNELEEHEREQAHADAALDSERDSFQGR